MKNLKITTIQSNLHWENKTANLKMFEEKLSRLNSYPDIVLLPEMFTTGFTNNRTPLAETMDGVTMKWIAEQAKEVNAVICGSFIVVENGQYFNRLIWMNPDGEYKTYDKRHLFTLAKEDEFYTAGKERLIVELEGWKICPLICYDLRFPVWSRNNVDYDLLIYIANWPEKRAHHWKSLLLGRAIENQCYTIGVNRIGKDGNDFYYSGDTALIDYKGETIFQTSHVENAVTTEIALQPQQAFRQKLAFLNDQDEFQIS